jgi:hypothetical protein
LITAPNVGSGGGSCPPLRVVVALDEPGVAVTCCAMPEAETSRALPKHCNCFCNLLFKNLIAVNAFLNPGTNVLLFNLRLVEHLSTDDTIADVPQIRL